MSCRPAKLFSLSHTKAATAGKSLLLLKQHSRVAIIYYIRPVSYLMFLVINKSRNSYFKRINVNSFAIFTHFIWLRIRYRYQHSYLHYRHCRATIYSVLVFRLIFIISKRLQICDRQPAARRPHAVTSRCDPRVNSTKETL